MGSGEPPAPGGDPLGDRLLLGHVAVAPRHPARLGNPGTGSADTAHDIAARSRDGGGILPGDHPAHRSHPDRGGRLDAGGSPGRW